MPRTPAAPTQKLHPESVPARVSACGSPVRLRFGAEFTWRLEHAGQIFYRQERVDVAGISSAPARPAERGEPSG